MGVRVRKVKRMRVELIAYGGYRYWQWGWNGLRKRGMGMGNWLMSYSSVSPVRLYAPRLLWGTA